MSDFRNYEKKFVEVDRTTEYYSDVLTNFDFHPQKYDLARLTNENAVKRSIRNLMMTSKYERLFNPNLGSNIKKALFEPIGPISQLELKDAITETIENFEPRAKLIDVTVNPYIDQQAYVIDILFYVINKATPISFQTTLYRVR
jgi:phage baseplate assembly protein W